MTERDILDREIHALSRIMKDNRAALRSAKTSVGDRTLLRLQIGVRTAVNAVLMKRRDTLKY